VEILAKAKAYELKKKMLADMESEVIKK